MNLKPRAALIGLGLLILVLMPNFGMGTPEVVIWELVFVGVLVGVVWTAYDLWRGRHRVPTD